MKAHPKVPALFLLSLFIAFFIEAPIATAQNSTICLPKVIASQSNLLGWIGKLEGDLIAYSDGRGERAQGYLYQISTGTTTPIINGDFSTAPIDIEGDLILTTAPDPAIANFPENADIFLYRISTGQVTRLTQSAEEEGATRIQGDYIASMTAQYKYYLHRISTGEMKDISPTFPRGMSSLPAFHGDVIAWDYATSPLPTELGSDIAYHRISIGETKAVGDKGTADAERPEVYGDYIVWQRVREDLNPISGDIALFNVVTETLTLITDDDVHNGRPLIEGDYVIWARFDGNDDELFQYQISTGVTTQLTDNDVDDFLIDFADDTIHYSDSSFALRLMKRSTGEITTINPSLTSWLDLIYYTSQTSQGRVIYEPLGTQDMYFYDPANPDPCAPNLLRNGSFENGFKNWTGTNRTDDTVACTNLSKGRIRSYHQKCGFRFVGSPGENSSISQTVNLRQSGLKAGEKITFGAWVWPVRALPKGRITALVTLKSGQTQRVGIPFPQTTSGGFTLLKKTITLNGAPASLKFTISNQSTKREVRLDRAFVFVEPPAGEMTSLPAAQPVTDGLRGSN
jgi:hypothetical protein